MVARVVFAVGVGLAGLSWTGRAGADDEAKACGEASIAGQRLRADHKLREAREALLRCTQERCPALIRRDCIQYLEAVEASLPTIVVSVRNADGTERIDVRVLIDGVLGLEKIDGRSFGLDPGAHFFRFEPAGARPFEEQIVVHEGEKNQRVSVTVPGLPAPGLPMTSASPAKAPAGPTLGFVVAASVVGGIGVLAVASAAYFGVRGASDFRHLDDTCHTTCRDEDVQTVRREFHIADASMVIALVAGGVTAWLLLSHHTGPKASVGLFAPTMLGARF
jgi:hypothetical protein